MNTPTDLGVYPGWCDQDLLPVVRSLFTYGPGEDRATGEMSGDWLAELLDRLESTLGVRFTIVAFQAYRDGSGCGWHTDDPFDAQAVLSLGVTRTFGVRPMGGEPEWIRVRHGDLVYMPSGFQKDHEHCVPVEDVPGERISLVFRTPRS